MQIRKLQNPRMQEALEAFTIDAEAEGFEFIELMINKRSSFPKVIMGLEEVKVREQRTPGINSSVMVNSKIINDGNLTFNPDAKKRLWGYMLASEKNKKWLASIIVKNTVSIIDGGRKKEIKKLAESYGFATEIGTTRHTADDYLKRGTSEVDELKAEIEALKAEKLVELVKVTKTTKK